MLEYKEANNTMETRSYYGYYGHSGGYTGENDWERNYCNQYFDFLWKRFRNGKVVEKSFFRIFGIDYLKALSEAREIAKSYGCTLELDM